MELIMFELSKDTFHLAQHLLQEQEGYLVPKAIIEQKSPGRIFVNSQSNPEIAIIWSKGNNGFYFTGNNITNYTEEINNFIDSYLIPTLLCNDDWFETSSVPPLTDTELKSVLKSRNLNIEVQTEYMYKKTDRIPNAHNTNVYKVQDIFKTKHLVTNIDFVQNKILNYWDSIDTFLVKADGFCLIQNNTIVSLAITGWIARNMHEISIETLKDYRRKGFAKICASALINCYLEKGYIPYWECMKANTASVKLVEGFGFTKLYDYDLIEFRIN
jgi:ribosomal protein S18 acetylase RimI-like enzyme